jgi:hypothetical protein
MLEGNRDCLAPPSGQPRLLMLLLALPAAMAACCSFARAGGRRWRQANAVSTASRKQQCKVRVEFGSAVPTYPAVAGR